MTPLLRYKFSNVIPRRSQIVSKLPKKGNLGLLVGPEEVNEVAKSLNMAQLIRPEVFP